ncbi:6309_t:CDS:2 [Diversispora eburnea]|uniref:6309_t:CDS:1 n=1 Tax=Diversispora eburnea TaxID=1213867 RepID=A0A9N9FQC5_9GLOM|nr:6309_t:CDS:2 [Diversispora eburnea]
MEDWESIGRTMVRKAQHTKWWCSRLNHYYKYCLARSPFAEVLQAMSNTDDSANAVTDDSPSYPIHSVDNLYRGDLIAMDFICIYWVDGDHTPRWKECKYSDDFDGKDEVPTSYTSPWWAAGYRFGAYDEYWGEYFNTDDVMWYNDNQSQKYCNDLHFHIKPIYLKLSYDYSISNDKCYWE